MSERRFPELDDEDMTSEQRAVVDSILSGPRGGASRRITGPFQPLLRSPRIADRVQALGAEIRFASSIPAPLAELAILLTARRWTAQYEWAAHRTLALDAGLDPAWVASIARGERLEGLEGAAAAVNDFATELLEHGSVSDAVFAAAFEHFGERGVVDLVATVGYYGLIAFVLNVDRTPPPPGELGLQG